MKQSKKARQQEKQWRKRTFKEAMGKELREHRSSFVVFYLLRLLVFVVLVRDHPKFCVNLRCGVE